MTIYQGVHGISLLYGYFCQCLLHITYNKIKNYPPSCHYMVASITYKVTNDMHNVNASNIDINTQEYGAIIILGKIVETRTCIEVFNSIKSFSNILIKEGLFAYMHLHV